MFGGNNANSAFPFFLEENPLCYDSNASTQLQLFGNVPSTCEVGQINHIGGNNNIRSLLNQPIKRSRGSEEINKQNNVQISLSNPFPCDADRSPTIPKLNTVSTGLRLSYDDEELHSSVTTAGGFMSSLPLTLPFLDNIGPEIERQMEEIDRYMRTQEQQLAKGVKELKQRHAASFLSAIDRELSQKLHDKDLEIESMNRKNRELADRIRQASAEAHTWQQRAQYNESVVHALRTSLQQAVAQGAGAGSNHGREGCGDSEVDDAASSFGPDGGDDGRRRVSMAMACRGCVGREVCMLLLPCRHLCLCKECDAVVDACPVCFVRKTASVEVYMS